MVEVRRRGESDATGDRAPEISQDVAEQVVGHHDVVAMRILDEVDAGRVDMVVGGLDTGVLGGDLVEGALPQVASEREHVRLVDQGDVAGRSGLGELEGVPDAALDTVTRVHRALGGHLLGRAPAKDTTLADIGPLGVLTDHHEVVGLGVPRRRARERPLIDEEIELETHLEQEPALDDPGRHPRVADRAEQDRVEAAEVIEDGIRQDLAVAQVTSTTEIEVAGLDVDTGGPHHPEGLSRHLRPDSVSSDDRDAMCHRAVNLLEGDPSPTWHRPAAAGVAPIDPGSTHR